MEESVELEGSELDVSASLEESALSLLLDVEEFTASLLEELTSEFTDELSDAALLAVLLEEFSLLEVVAASLDCDDGVDAPAEDNSDDTKLFEDEACADEPGAEELGTIITLCCELELESTVLVWLDVLLSKLLAADETKEALWLLSAGSLLTALVDSLLVELVVADEMVLLLV